AYDRAAYEARAGIVDVDVSAHPEAASLLAEGALALRVDAPNGPAVLLAERELTAFCDECNVYLDEGETRTLTIHARYRGHVPAVPLSILAAWYSQADDIVFSGQMTVLPVSAEGTAELQINAEAPGYRHLRVVAFAGDSAPIPPPRLSIATAQFTSVRILPFDDALAAATPDEELSWEFVYSTILQTYDAIAPRMNNFINLRDGDAVRTFARRIKEVTAPELLESARYMPVTRDLSRGKRTLLHRFCDLALGPPSVETAVTGPAAVPSPAPEVLPPGVTDRLPGVPADVSFRKRARS
ncbi:MAG: hypothetical protein ACRDTT_33450, partial [Pseudonocardiaceae bacterium]